MTRRLLTPLGTLALAMLAMLALGHGLGAGEHELAADGAMFLQDADGDFLPDLLEWVALGNTVSADTDGDSSSDFVEVVQRGIPWVSNPPKPADHEMCILVTSHVDSSGEPQVWMHVLLRLMGDERVVQSFSPWIHSAVYPGLRVPLGQIGWQQVQIGRRASGGEGLWYRVSLHLASEAVLRPFMPLMIGAEATLGGRRVQSGSHVFSTAAGVATLVPAPGGVVSQYLQQPPERTGSSNKYCLMKLSDMGGGPGGRIYEVDSAECKSANDLECTLECPQSAGSVFILPNGIEIITGG